MRRDGNGREKVPLHGPAANDNPGSKAGTGGPEARIDAAVMRLARLLGRQIAREQFEATQAANDNAPAGKAGDGQETRDRDPVRRARPLQPELLERPKRQANMGSGRDLGGCGGGRQGQGSSPREDSPVRAYPARSSARRARRDTGPSARGVRSAGTP